MSDTSLSKRDREPVAPLTLSQMDAMTQMVRTAVGGANVASNKGLNTEGFHHPKNSIAAALTRSGVRAGARRNALGGADGVVQKKHSSAHY